MSRSLQAFLVLVMLFLSASLIFGGQVEYTLTVDPPNIEVIDGQAMPVFHQGWTISPAGEPLVPRVGAATFIRQRNWGRKGIQTLYDIYAYVASPSGVKAVCA